MANLMDALSREIGSVRDNEGLLIHALASLLLFMVRKQTKKKKKVSGDLTLDEAFQEATLTDFNPKSHPIRSIPSPS